MEQGRREGRFILGEGKELGPFRVRPRDEYEIRSRLREDLVEVGIEAVQVLENADAELGRKLRQVEMEDVIVEGEGCLHPVGHVLRLRLAHLGEHPVVSGLRGELRRVLGENGKRDAQEQCQYEGFAHTTSSFRS